MVRLRISGCSQCICYRFCLCLSRCFLLLVMSCFLIALTKGLNGQKSRTLKVFSNCHCLFVGQVMSPHHSDQMSQRSQVKGHSVVLWRLWLLVVPEQARDQGTRSPIELFWTAKKFTRNLPVLRHNPIGIRLKSFCKEINDNSQVLDFYHYESNKIIQINHFSIFI